MIEYKPESYLVPYSERDPEGKGLYGTKQILTNPLFDKLSKRMREEFIPKHKYILFSLCTKTRPYINSLKWKCFIKNFEKYCDLVIASSGGIIPLEYSYCYPFLQYDDYVDPVTKKSKVVHSKEINTLYNEKFINRLDAFLKLHESKYEKLIFAFLPTTRNRKALLEHYKDRNNFYIVPSLEVYEKVLKEGSPGVNVFHYPHNAHQSIEEIYNILGVKSNKKRGKLF